MIGAALTKKERHTLRPTILSSSLHISPVSAIHHGIRFQLDTALHDLVRRFICSGLITGSQLAGGPSGAHSNRGDPAPPKNLSWQELKISDIAHQPTQLDVQNGPCRPASMLPATTTT